MGKRKSRYSPAQCNYREADGCKGFVNSKTARAPNMCMACWQKRNAKSLNQRRNVWSFEGSKKRLMRLPVSKWPSVE